MFVAGTVVLAWVFGSRMIPVRRIACMNQFGKCSDLITNNLDSIKKSNLFNAKRSVKKTLQNSVLVKE